jgi:hypothetical protein
MFFLNFPNKPLNQSAPTRPFKLALALELLEDRTMLSVLPGISVTVGALPPLQTSSLSHTGEPPETISLVLQDQATIGNASISTNSIWSFANPAKIPVSIVYKASRGLAGQIEAD